LKADQPPLSGLYVGKVMHQRLRPLRHRLQYRMFSLLLDIDQLHASMRRQGVEMLERIEGPPRWDGPELLLRHAGPVRPAPVLALAPAEAGALGLGPESSVLLVLTEGVTDPENHARILASTADGR